MSRGRHEATNSRRTVAGLVLMVLWVATLFGATWAAADPPAVPGAPSTDGVQPVIEDTKASSDRCVQLGFDHGLTLTGNGSKSSDALTVSISGFNSPSGFVAWSSNLPIHGVYVKGGPSGNLFSYPTGDIGDQDLHTPQKSNGGFYAVGVVAVCWNDVPVPAEPDVTVTKSNAPEGAVQPGDTITYSLRVANVGDADATQVVVTDQLPAAVTFVGELPSGCTELAGTITCDLGEIGPGAAFPDVVFAVTVDETTCSAIENSAHVSASNETGAATENNDSNTVTNTVACFARLAELPPDLQVTKSSNATGPLHEGDKIVYTITASNVGDATATGVRLVDVLPVGATAVGGSPFPFFGGEACTLTSSIPSPSGVPHTEVHCGPIPLDAGETATVTVTTTVTDDACGQITNNVDVEASNEPAEHAGPDNHAEATDEIECPPRIRVVKSGPRRAHLGDTATYVFKVRNLGGTALTDVELTDPGCDGPATLIDDGNGNAALGINERWRYTCDQTIVAADGDPVHRVAKVTGDHPGGRVSDKDTHVVDVLHPGIRIEQSASPASGAPGSTAVYSYVVTNTGDATLFDISVVDDTLGHVGDIDALAPGASATRTFGIVLGSSPITNVGTATGSDTLGMTVSDNDGATVTIVAAGNDGTGAGGSPFTGFGASALGALAVVLSAVGVAFLALTARRSPVRIDPSAGTEHAEHGLSTS